MSKSVEEIVDKATERRWVLFRGDCDFLPLVSEDYERNPKTGKIVDKIPGLAIRFKNGLSRPYDMEYGPDREEVERIREWLDTHGEKDPRIFRFNVREEEPEAVAPPFNNFDKLNAKAIVEMVTNMLPEGKAEQRGFIENAITYEAQNKSRKTVIQGLGEMLSSDVEDEAVSDVEVSL